MRCRRISLLVALFSSFLITNAKQEILSHTAYGTLKRYNATSLDQLHVLSEIAQEHGLDIWHISQTRLDVYYPPNAQEVAILDQYNHTTSRIDPTPPTYQTQEDQEKWNLNSLPNTTFHATYHPLFEIDQFIYDLADTFPDLVRVVQLGHSANGREMLGLAISNSTTVNRKKKAYVIMGAQHAREWVASATALYTAHALVAHPSEAFSLRYLLDSFDFYIVPVPNPDGYVYTWETDRFWYKNRQIASSSTKCVGLDMNRNWGYKWKPRPVPEPTKKKHRKPTADVDPCSHWYPGSRAFQAPETNNIANFVTSIPDIHVFIDFRSYGQMLSSPYSYTCKRVAKDAEDQLEAGMGAVHELYRVHGTSYQAGPLCQTLYEAPGNVVDWMYARAGIKYSYAAHLRDTGTYGFSLPAEWIRPVGEETAKMVEYLAKFILSKK